MALRIAQKTRLYFHGQQLDGLVAQTSTKHRADKSITSLHPLALSSTMGLLARLGSHNDGAGTVPSTDASLN